MLRKKRIIIGARGSRLSIIQAKEIVSLLKKKSAGYAFSLKKIVTSGDKNKAWRRDDRGIFVKEIEEALLSGKIDLAVHSAKDLPTEIPSGLRLAGITKRESPYDCVIFREKTSFSRLKKGALIGTGSPRRKSQLLRLRPDLKIKNLRGNLDTRIKKLENGEFDAIIAAVAGIKRLGYKNLSLECLPPKIMLPAAGQGALGIEIRAKDKIAENFAKIITDLNTLRCVGSERVFLKEIKAGCRLPVGALAQIKNRRIFLETNVLSPDGKRVISLKKSARARDFESLGRALAKEAIKKGAKQILKANETKM